MKQITNKTILKQVCKTGLGIVTYKYQPAEIDGVIYWETKDFNPIGAAFYIYTNSDKTKEINWKKDGAVINETKIVAQSQPHLEGIPVVSLDSYWSNKSNLSYHLANPCPNQYTQKDIEKAILFWETYEGNSIFKEDVLVELFNHINSISVIEVDEQFNILSYE
jgi:hypothetical protein